jgi:hypothetical protein
MRIVRQGTEQNLYRLTEADLPNDGSLKGSYFKWVDLSDHDLSTYGMQFVSTADCVAHNVTLGEIEYLYSRRTDWADSKIPSNVSSLSHDLVEEVLRQHTAPPGSEEERIITWTLNHIGASYLNSWTTAAYHVIEELGWTREQDIECFTKYAFGGYPRLLNRLRSHLAKPLSPEPPTYTATKLIVEDPRPIPADVVKMYGKKTYELPFDQLKTVGDDIWGAARAAEQYLEQKSGIGGWKVVVFSLEPFVVAFAAHGDKTTNEDVWWSQGMGK